MSKYRKDQEARLAEQFKALGHPHRLRIFNRLLDCCAPGTVCAIGDAAPNCVSELGAELDIAASTLSHHIKSLAQAGLIRLERRGQFIDCQADTDAVETLRAAFAPTTRATNKRKRS
jgi:ArsR family transcriptional regulator